ncbi:MAG: hypothetical protein WAO02_01040 [Verrucomicrobiia bacterium]
MNEVLPEENLLSKDPGTKLMGEGAVLDSMGFVNFVVALEEALAGATGLNINVVEELNATGNQKAGSKTLGELADFLLALVKSKLAGSP